MNEALIEQLEGLRECYPADNRVGLLLDELVADIRAGAPHEEVLGDAETIAAELGEMATATKFIRRAVAALT
jgi:hypothetical protein